MNNRWCRAVFGALVLIAPLFISAPSGAATVRVPTEKQSISKALQFAQARDTILVAPGEYTDLLNYLGKAIVVISEAGPAVTIIKPMDQYKPVGTFASVESRGAMLIGVTITGYTLDPTPGAPPALEFTNRGSPTIKNCVFRDNRGVMMVRVADDGPLFIRCLFYNNSGAPVIGVFGGMITLLNCTIDRCEYGVFMQSVDCEIRNTIISNCHSYGVHGAVSQFDWNNVWNNGVNYEEGAVPGLHDVSVNPLYVDDVNHDYRLQPGSPCINMGDPNPYLNDPDSTRGDIGYWYYQLPTAVGDEESLPTGFALDQNYPNPFNPSTHISFVLPRRARVRLDVINAVGGTVRSLIDAPLSAGRQVIEWDGLTDQGTRAASGVYFYRLVADDFVSTRKMVLIK
ncbi:MAG: right-handed parallel beta-helix repeat-containing protein [candidate division Zixibacteria bacterium]|nr:right-handed parallel beta-helix repeat-containing protein [candidate division Zixibacteria bacterium]